MAGVVPGGGGTVPPSAIPRMLFYHLDHLGSPRIITNESGGILRDNHGVEVGRHHYMPFGEELPLIDQASSNTRQFTGHERDAESGLDYMLARYHSSSLGRFMAVDPDNDTTLEDPQSWNRYAYVRNNPISFLDPSGRDRMPAHDASMEASLRRLGYDAVTAGRMSSGAGAVDRGVASNVILSPELHFGGRPTLNHLINGAIDAYGRGDVRTGDELRRMANHLSDDMHIHDGYGLLKHFVLKIAGWFQQKLKGHNTLDPDSPESPGYSKGKQRVIARRIRPTET